LSFVEPPDPDGAGAELAEPAQGWVPVRVGANWYSLRVSSIVEILDWVSPMPIPTAPAHVIGVLTRRGHTVPVIQLRACLEAGGVEAARSGFARIVVVDVDDMRVGCQVDEVLLIGAELPSEPAPLDIASVLQTWRVRQ